MKKNTKILVFGGVALLGTLSLAATASGLAISYKYKKENKLLTKRNEEINKQEKDLKDREVALQKNQAEFQIFEDFYSSYYWIQRSLNNHSNKYTYRYIDKLKELNRTLDDYVSLFKDNATEENKGNMKRLGSEAKAFRLDLEKQGIFLDDEQE